MDWQLTVVIAVLAVAVAFVARCVWRRLHGRADEACHSGCDGCPLTDACRKPRDHKRIF